jgi:AcrR family transcriptional regulator
VAGGLFYDHGIQAVGMAQIIDAAECGKNVLYRHFPSKADLVTAYLTQFAREREADAERALEGLDDDPAAALVELTRLIARQAARDRFRGCAIRNYLREFRTHDDLPGRTARELLAAWRRRVDTLVSRLDDEDPRALADRIWLIQEGLYCGTHDDPLAAGKAAVGLVGDLVGQV